MNARIEWHDGATGMVTADGKALEYACHGPAPTDGWTIVMLHEGLGSVAMWRDFPQRVAKRTGMGVFVYSRAGYGGSDACALPRPIDYMTQEATDVLPDLLDAIGVERAILFGHSDGATIAAIHAGMVEDFRIRGIVLMAPHFFTEPEALESIREAKAQYDNGSLREKLAKYHDDVDVAFRGWNDAWLSFEAADWNVAETIDYLRVPTLAIQGRDDRYGTLAQIAEIEDRSYAPVDTLILDGCGHAPHEDRPDETLAAVEEFAARLKRIETVDVPIR